MGRPPHLFYGEGLLKMGSTVIPRAIIWVKGTGPTGWSKTDTGPAGWSSIDTGPAGWSSTDTGPAGWSSTDTGPAGCTKACTAFLTGCPIEL